MSKVTNHQCSLYDTWLDNFSKYSFQNDRSCDIVMIITVLGVEMGIGLGKMLFYIISGLLTIGGFTLVAMAHTTVVLATGALLIVAGLIIFLIIQETMRQPRVSDRG